MTTELSAGHISELVIAEEVTKGIPPAIATGLRDYHLDGLDINPIQKVIPLGNVQQRHRFGYVLGKYHMKGVVPQNVTPNGHIGYWLGGAIGGPSSAQQGGTVAYKHTYTPADDLPTHSAWLKRGGNQQVLIPYVVVDKLLLEQNIDVLKSTTTIIGQKDPLNSDDFTTADAYDTINPFQNIDLAVTGPVGAADVFNSKILIDNKYNVDKGYVHGSRFYNALVPGKREITGQFEIWFDDDGDYQSFWGSSAATTPTDTGEYSTVPLNLKWDSNIEAASGYNYCLEIDLPEAVYVATEVKIEDRIRQIIDWSAQYDTSDTYEIEAYLTNKVVSYP